MTQLFDISEELAAYFNRLDTRRAVNHMLSSDKGSEWIDLSIEDFKTLSDSFDGYDKYASAWLYSKKVQKDYFDFMGAVWRSAWNRLISNFNENIKQPTKFKTVEDVWADGWYRSFDLKRIVYDDLWLYCEKLGEDQKDHAIRLSLSLGIDDDYSMESLNTPPENWPKEDESGDSYFRKDISFRVEKQKVEIVDLKPLTKEMEDYLRNKVFKI